MGGESFQYFSFQFSVGGRSVGFQFLGLKTEILKSENFLFERIPFVDEALAHASEFIESFFVMHHLGTGASGEIRSTLPHQ